MTEGVRTHPSDPAVRQDGHRALDEFVGALAVLASDPADEGAFARMETAVDVLAEVYRALGVSRDPWVPATAGDVLAALRTGQVSLTAGVLAALSVAADHIGMTLTGHTPAAPARPCRTARSPRIWQRRRRSGKGTLAGVAT